MLATVGRRVRLPAVSHPDPATVVRECLDQLDADWRSPAPGEWGLSVEAAGWPLHIGIALRDGLLRIQAQIAEPGAIELIDLLWWNRRLPLLRFSATRGGEPWLQLDLDPHSLDTARLDRMLGYFVLTATQARETIRGRPADGSP